MKKLILLISLSLIPLYSFGENVSNNQNVNLVATKINLVEKFSLSETNKIIIEASTLKPRKQLIRTEVTDPQIIAIILQELKSVKTRPVCYCITDISLKFLTNNNIIEELKYNSDLGFLRYRHGIDYDYITSEKFNGIVKKELKNKL